MISCYLSSSDDAHKIQQFQLLTKMNNKKYNQQLSIASIMMAALILVPTSAELPFNRPLKRLRTGKDVRWTFQFSGLPNDPQSVMIDLVDKTSEDDILNQNSNQDSNNVMDDFLQSSRDENMSMKVPSTTPTNVDSVSLQPSTMSRFPMGPSTSDIPSTDSPIAIHLPTKSPITLVPVTVPIATPVVIPPVARPTLQPFVSPVTKFPIPTNTPTGFPLESTAPTNLPSLSPTMICGMTAQQRRDEIVRQVTDALGTNAVVLFNVTSPQSQALTWLLNERNETTCPGRKLLQRWVLATMYYSTGGDHWFKCSGHLGASDNCGSEAPFVGKKRFLSEDNECLWAGITCDVDKCVTEIEFGT
jgi:hypothetical protein